MTCQWGLFCNDSRQITMGNKELAADRVAWSAATSGSRKKQSPQA